MFPVQNTRMDRAQSGQSVQRTAKGKATSILLASSIQVPQNSIHSVTPSPRSSVLLFPLHGWNIRFYRHVSISSLPVWVLVAGGEMEGAVYVGRRLLVGGNTGMIVMMMDTQGHRCSLPLIFASCQIELGKLFSFLFLGMSAEVWRRPATRTTCS